MMEKMRTWSVALIALGSAVLGFLSANEYDRLGHGFRLDMLHLRGYVLNDEASTFGSGPPFSFSTNGRMDFHYRQSQSGYQVAEGAITFPQGEKVPFRIVYSLRVYDEDIRPVPVPNLLPSADLNGQTATLRITSSDVMKLRKQGDSQLVAKLDGVYFVVYLTLSKLEHFPKQGEFSIVVH